VQVSEQQFVAISAAASGANTLVAADATHKIRVVQFFLVAAGAVVATFQSGAGGTALTGPMSLITGVDVDASGPFGLFETAVNTLLNLNLSGAVQVSGFLVYVLAT
jgi:hypothetical protein